MTTEKTDNCPVNVNWIQILTIYTVYFKSNEMYTCTTYVIDPYLKSRQAWPTSKGLNLVPIVSIRDPQAYQDMDTSTSFLTKALITV